MVLLLEGLLQKLAAVLGNQGRKHALRDHEKEELSFYSKATTDIEYLFPFGWGELWGIADRTNYDLKQHQDHSGKSLEYFDPSDNTRYTPLCVEPSLGADRVALAFLCEAYDEEEVGEKDTPCGYASSSGAGAV
mgnify:CR=1 FL=1